MGWWPWCCCGGCTIASDQYDSDTSPKYTDESGSATVSGGERTTSSGTFLSVHNTSGTTGHGKVTVRGKVSVSGGKFRVVGSYVDASNYLFAEVTINGASSTLKLWKRESGSDTQLGGTYVFSGATGTYYLVELCWNGETATTAINNVARAGDIFTGSGNQAGYGANLSSGTAAFDDFTFTKHIIDDASCDECSPGGCSSCSDYVHTITVDIADLTDGSCACSADNGHTYVIRLPADGTCSDRVLTGRSPCGAGANSAVEAGLISVSGSTFLYVAYITKNAIGGVTTQYRTTVGATPARCTEIADGTVLAFNSTTDTGFAQCGSGSATITVTIN